jgi:peptidoglycan/LPS O-acetylase OafA/YrhL
MKKLDYIDALRGLAILSVMMIHTINFGTINPSGKFQNVILSGKMGVQLFFLASAFTLFLSYKNRLANEIYPVRNFFIRRFFRIAPMYYLGICYYLFQNGFGPSYWLGDVTHISALNITSNFTFLHGFNAEWINSVVPGGWSIGVEMMFYAIMPFLFSKIKNINQAFMFFAGSLLLNVLLYGLFLKFQINSNEVLLHEYLFFYLPSQLPVFLLGVLLYFIVIEKESIRNISGKWILVVVCQVLLNLTTDYKIILPIHIIYGIVYFMLAYTLSLYRFKLLVNPVMKYIGKISFSMYLVHFAVLYWLQRLNFTDILQNGNLNYILRYLIVVSITVAVSTLFYNVVEVPFQNLGKNIIDRWEKKNTQLAVAVNKTTNDI